MCCGETPFRNIRNSSTVYGVVDTFGNSKFHSTSSLGAKRPTEWSYYVNLCKVWCMSARIWSWKCLSGKKRETQKRSPTYTPVRSALGRRLGLGTRVDLHSPIPQLWAILFRQISNPFSYSQVGKHAASWSSYKRGPSPSSWRMCSRVYSAAKVWKRVEEALELLRNVLNTQLSQMSKDRRFRQPKIKKRTSPSANVVDLLYRSFHHLRVYLFIFWLEILTFQEHRGRRGDSQCYVIDRFQKRCRR